MKINKKLKWLMCILAGLVMLSYLGFQVSRVCRRTLAFVRINSYISDRNYTDCVKYIDGLIKGDPGYQYYYNRRGYALMKLEKPSEALKSLKKALALKPEDDTVMTNMSWAYYNLGNYKEALNYSKKALRIDPKDSITLVNEGNALRKLGKLTEALSAYKTALKHSPSYNLALYGKGITEYDLGNYKAAIDTFTGYNKLVKDDYDSYIYLGEAYYFESRYGDSIKNLTYAAKLDPKNNEPYYYMGFCYNDQDMYAESIKMFSSAIKIDPKDSEAYYQRGKAYYYSNQYKKSLESLDMAIRLDPNYSYPYSWKARNYLRLRNYKLAVAFASKAIAISPKDSYPYVIKAKIYNSMGMPEKALGIIEKAIKLEPDYSEPYISKAEILYDNGYYRECIGFVEEALKKDKFKKDTDLIWYLGDSYSALGKHSIAIKLYEGLKDELAKNDELQSDLGWEYYYTQDYTRAEKFGNKALSLNSSNQDAKNLIKNIKYSKLGENIKISDFVKYNYLYLNKVGGFSSKTRKFLALKKTNFENIINYLSSIVYKGDRFTYFIGNEYYNEYMRHEEKVNITSKSLKPGLVLVKIPSFGENTGDEVKKYLLSLKATQNDILVIDLRDNPGGLITSANEILDLLLPKCTASYLVYRDGYKFAYTSDSDMLKFKKIIIMVNENSASSSELLSLSLKKHLNNVTIIGHKTFGKGVGQETYENKSKKFVILLTSFYWYVENINISKSKITPDVIIQGSKDADYYNYVYGTAAK